MVAFLLTCLTIWLSLLSVWCFIGAIPWGQQSTPALTLPHVRDGLSVRRGAVLCPCSMLSVYRHGHRQFMRNAWHNFTTIVPVTVYYQGSYVETYSRYMQLLLPSTVITSQMTCKAAPAKYEAEYATSETHRWVARDAP